MKESMRPRQQRFSPWYAVIVTLIILASQTLFMSKQVDTLPHSDFKASLHVGKIEDVAVGSQDITGTFFTEGVEALLMQQQVDAIHRMGKGDHPFQTFRVNDPALVQELEAVKMRFVGWPDNKWLNILPPWVVPAFLFFAVWNLPIRCMGGTATGGLMEIGKSKAKTYMQKETGATLADVTGVDEAKDELLEIVSFLKEPPRYQSLGGRIPKGVLFVGASGTDKTLFAKAVTGEVGVSSLDMSGPELVEMSVGTGAARVRNLFSQTESMAPCIIFIDELDVLGKTRAFNLVGGNEEREQTLNQLLIETDGSDSNKGVIIVAAANRPETLNPVPLCPGRFDRHVALDCPDLKGRKQIPKVHAKNVTLGADVDLGKIAARTSGFAGADLASLVNGAALLVVREGKPAVETTDLDQTLDRIVDSLEKKNRVMNVTEKEVIAYHETDHAIVTEHRPLVDRVSKVSIIPRGIAALGYIQQTPVKDRYSLKHSELLNRFGMLLGGYAAEQIVYHDVLTGVQNDLRHATDIARQMITQFSMSEQLGLAAYEQTSNPLLAGTGLMQRERKEYSEDIAQLTDAEVCKVLPDANARVTATLKGQRAKPDALSHTLLDKEMVDHYDLDIILAGNVTLMSPPKAEAGFPVGASALVPAQWPHSW